MQERRMKYQCLIVIWVLLLIGSTQITRAVTYANPYVGSTRVGSSVVQTTAQSVSVPGYEFQSTSIFAPTTGTPKIDFVPLADGAGPLYTGSGMRKGGLPGDPSEGGEEVGTVTEPPVGEPLVLLLFAMLYVVSRLFRRAKE